MSHETKTNSTVPHFSLNVMVQKHDRFKHPNAMTQEDAGINVETMMAYIFDGRILAKQISGMVVMVLCISLMAIIGAGDKAQAALLDGLLTGVEEALAERVISKGEPLKLGNFYTVEQPNVHGPIGIMGDHTHDQGEVMFSYRYMHMFMEGTRNGTTRITNAQARALGAFPVVPESMRMEMHMFGAMYGGE